MAEPHLELKTTYPLRRMAAFSTIGKKERQNILSSLHKPLSGYIGGDPKGGYWVERLADEWRMAFEVEHAVPCNSATSGLLAACMACGIEPETEVWTTPYSMSATAACAKILGANVRFIDIEPDRFGIDPKLLKIGTVAPKAIIVTNLFGHPAHLSAIKKWCDKNNVWMIEDNAQAPFATENGKYTGTIGDIGVFSLNVHKHIQCGEGGVVVTKDPVLRDSIQRAINHGELDTRHPRPGLNLRMTEPIAAIACAQLAKAKEVINERRELALCLTENVKDIPWIVPHGDDEGCRHVYYLWTALVDLPIHRHFVVQLQDYGIPIRGGYAPLLNKLFNSKDECPVAADINDRIIVFEVCAWDVKLHHLQRMRSIIHNVAEEIEDGTTSTDATTSARLPHLA